MKINSVKVNNLLNTLNQKVNINQDFKKQQIDSLQEEDKFMQIDRSNILIQSLQKIKNDHLKSKLENSIIQDRQRSNIKQNKQDSIKKTSSKGRFRLNPIENVSITHRDKLNEQEFENKLYYNNKQPQLSENNLISQENNQQLFSFDNNNFTQPKQNKAQYHQINKNPQFQDNNLRQYEQKQIVFSGYKQVVNDEKLQKILRNLKVEKGGSIKSLQSISSIKILKNGSGNNKLNQEQQENKPEAKDLQQLEKTPIYNIDRGFSMKVTKKLERKKYSSINDRIQTLPTERNKNENLLNINQISPHQYQLYLDSIEKKKIPIDQSNSINNHNKGVNQIYFNQNQYQFSQGSSSFNDSNKNSTKNSQSSVNFHRNKQNKRYTECLDQIRSSDEKNQNTDKQNLYLIYKEQQLSQDIGVEDKAIERQNHMFKLNSNDFKKQIESFQAENNQKENIKRDNNSQKYKYNSKRYQTENLENYYFDYENSMKNNRSQSLQQLIPIKSNVEFSFKNTISSQFDYKHNLQNHKNKIINNSVEQDNLQNIDDDEDEEEEQLQPIKQQQQQLLIQQKSQKKLTQNATMQTTFTETIPELVNKEIEQASLIQQQQQMQFQYQTQLMKQKKKRLVSYFSVNDKTFLSTTQDYMRKYKKDGNQNSNQDFNPQQIKQQTENDTTSNTTDQNEIFLPITVHTSKEEFLSQLNKRIQKSQFSQTTISNYNSEDQSNFSNQQLCKRVVFYLQDYDVLKKIKESNNPSLYELLKTYQLNGSLQARNNTKEQEQICIGPISDQAFKPNQKVFQYSKRQIICHIVLKKVRNKPSNHYDFNHILQQSSNAYKTQLLSSSLSNS